jgi:hypothetical protein
MPGTVVHTCNPSTQEVEAGGSQVPDQPELHSETLFQESNVWDCGSVVSVCPACAGSWLPSTEPKRGKKKKKKERKDPGSSSAIIYTEGEWLCGYPGGADTYWSSGFCSLALNCHG